jgi:hypothetical protein
VQLDDHVQAGIREGGDHMLADGLERRMFRPGRGVDNRRPRTIEAQPRADCRAVERSVHQAVDFRVTGEHRHAASGVNQSGGDITFESIAIRKKNAIEGADCRFEFDRRIEPVFPGHTVKQVHAAGPAVQPGHAP